MSDLVSILVPTYNREKEIAETINSALNQTYENIEIIVVDNSSTDSTWSIVSELAKREPKVCAFRNETNIGPVRNWMRCIEEANGFYAKILWSDDLISPDFVERCLKLMDSNTAFVYTGVRVFNESPDVGPLFYTGNTRHITSDEYLNAALLTNDVPVSPGCALFRLSDLRKNLLINIENKVNSDFSSHAIGNDLLIYLLTAKDYKKIGHVGEPLSFFRDHPGSISIQSGKGRLHLHYMLAKAYFTEKYHRELLDQLVARAFLLLKKQPDHSSYGFKGVNDFFYGDVKVKPSIIFSIKYKRFIKKVSRIVRN